MRRLFAGFWVAFFSFLLAGLCFASLPVQVDGQPLPTLAPMLQRAMPGVVNIATRSRVRAQSSPLMNDPFFRYFFNIPNSRQQYTQSLGSGVIVDARKGYVLTNYHVVAKADEITVTLSDERQLDAKLVGADPESDIAVIQVSGSNLVSVPWGDSQSLRVGDFVVAIGNPFGLGQTVTSGIVSAMGRSGLGIEAYEDFIQTDASINPGNSGGALVNLKGELVGINTAIIGPSGGNVGIGFAIPAFMAKQLMEQLIETGEVKRGSLGIVVQGLTGELASALDVVGAQGVVITQVEPASPADKAGLKAGDVVVEANGRRVRHSNDMRNVVGLQRIGQLVELAILRNGERKSVRVVIQEPERRAVKGGVLHPQLQGALLGNPDSTLTGASSTTGVLILDVARASAAFAVGLRKGDVITSVNRQRVRSVGELRKGMVRGPNGILLNIQRGEDALFLVLQ